MAVTISITDGVETRNINLTEAQTQKLIDTMNNMEAKRYRINEKILPITASGVTPLQQVRNLIIEIIKGTYYQCEKDLIQDTADTSKDSLNFG